MPPARPAEPDVSVVVATFNRARRLRALLDGLRAQSLAGDRFEVIVVDDASDDETQAVLADEIERGGLPLQAPRLDENSGPAAARQRGWKAARAAMIAFTDDDCFPAADWLERGLEASARHRGAIIQGATVADRDEWRRLPALARPFSIAVEVVKPDAHLQTCNVFYPRAVLEQVGGFDTDHFARRVGEDADLGARARDAGVSTVFAPAARVRHAYHRLGPLGKLRYAAKWDLKVYARHPGLRRACFTRGVFWKGSHYLLCRALVAALLPRRMRLVRAWLGLPYAVHLAERGRIEGGGIVAAPYFLLNDLIELAAALRASVRYRVPML